MSLRDLQNLEGRVALITGGSRGLGLQMAEVLGELGATLVITARKEAELEEAVVSLKSQSVKVEAMVNDLQDADSVQPMVEDILADVDMICLMSVNPGFGGQKFIERTFDKCSRLRTMSDANGLDLRIQIDGGVGPSNASQLIGAGADVLVAGTSVFGHTDYAAAIQALRG